MKCPICETEMKVAEREGVDIDYCPQCRGVWLDRGELEKIIARMEPRQHREQGTHGHDEDDDDDDERSGSRHREGQYRRNGEDRREGAYRYGGRKREGFLSNLFDMFGD